MNCKVFASNLARVLVPDGQSLKSRVVWEQGWSGRHLACWGSLLLGFAGTRHRPSGSLRLLPAPSSIEEHQLHCCCTWHWVSIDKYKYRYPWSHKHNLLAQTQVKLGAFWLCWLLLAMLAQLFCFSHSESNMTHFKWGHPPILSEGIWNHQLVFLQMKQCWPFARD